MRLLAIETSSDIASIAVLDGAGGCVERRFPAARHLCETLAPRIASLLADLSMQPDAIAIGLGPGSFTGLRIGLATAKALAHAWSLPLVGICSLHVAAAPLLTLGARCAAVAYARRGWVYLAAYAPAPDPSADPEVLARPQVAPIAEAAAAVWRLAADAPLVLCGPAALTAAVAAHGHARPGAVSILADWYPSARALAHLAAPLVPQADPAAAFSLRPMYLLQSQAERTKGIDLGMSR